MLTDGEAVTPVTDDPDLKKIGRWLSEITLYERESKDFIRRNRQIVKRFKDEREAGDQKSRLNMLWSMVQTMLPALYAKNPKPDIQRRFKDADPVGRVTSDVLERCVSYFCDTDKFAAAMRQSVLDYLLPGRGTVWCRYVPTMRQSDTEISEDAEEGEEETKDAPAETIAYEDVETDYVHATDFGHNICRTWEECWLVWRRVYLDRTELVRRFGKEAGNKPPLDYRDRDDKGRFTTPVASKSVIYELWDKKRKTAVWLHKDLPDALDVRGDPLQLDGFFPCPKPLLANLANDSIIPTPDFVEYQDQAQELDSLTARIASITKSLKVAGVYDASAQGLERLLAEGVENQLLPVENWAMFAEKGGLQGAISLLPLKDIVAGLVALYEARKRVKDDLYEITGIADIIRGNSEAEETASAQKIKSQFATMRISDRQRDVQRFVRETIRIMVDVICGHFQMETVKQISGVRLLSMAEKQATKAGVQPPGMTADQLETAMNDPSWEEVEQLIRNQPLRCFRIDIETDSTIKADEEAEKASRIEFLKAAGGFLQQASEVGAQQPEMVPLLCQMLMFGVRAFPVGKELEGAFNVAIQKLEKQAVSGQPKPSAEMMKASGELQIQQARALADQQIAHARLANEMELEKMRMAAKQQAEAAEAQSQMAADQRENELEAARDKLKAENELAISQAKIKSEAEVAITVAHIKAAAEIEVARITAKMDSGDEAEAREAAGEGQMPAWLSSFQQSLTADRELIRGPDGKATGMRIKPQTKPANGAA